jgi:hypothetical protein
MLAANLHIIEWVKPSFINQLPSGSHWYTIGAYYHEKSTNANEIKNYLDISPKAQLKVDWDHAYYSDNDSADRSEQFALPQTLQLHVSELKCEGPLVLSGDDPRVLDICLDYFACLNPYLTKISTKRILPLSKHSSLLCNNHDAATTSRLVQPICRMFPQLRQLLTEVLSTSNMTNTSYLDTMI